MKVRLKLIIKVVLVALVVFVGYTIYKNPELVSFSGTKIGERVVEQKVIDEESAVIEVVEKVSSAVVSIVVREVVFSPFSGPMASDASIGTGFLVDEKGTVFTNRHVVSQEAEYTVVFSDGKTAQVTSVERDPLNDFAILTIGPSESPPAGGGDYPYISLGNSDYLKVGQTVIAIGNALGRFSNTVTKGVVSALDRGLTASAGYFGGQSTSFEDVIQTDAALNPGNSGGPLVNLSGEVVGINMAVTSTAENIGFSIPINAVKEALNDFRTHGRIRRPFLGVEYVMVTKDISRLQRLPEGAFIQSIVEDSSADKAGLELGDIVTKFGDETLGEGNSLARVIRQHQVGDKVTLTIDRDGEILTLDVELGEVPEG